MTQLFISVAKKGGLSLLVAALFATVYTSSAFAVEAGGVGGRPANPDPNNSRTNSIFVYQLESGDSEPDAITLFNTTNEAKTVAVYPTDAISGSGGSFACKQRAETQTNVGSWLELAESTVEVPANGNTSVDFVVDVPGDTPPGEQNGCIAIEEQNQDPREVGNGVSISTRSAIRVSVTVPGDVTKDLTVLSVNGDSRNNKTYDISTTIRNSGNVSLDTDVRLTLSSLLGLDIASDGGVFPVLPDTQADFRFSVDRPFWGGWYKLTSVAQYDSSNNIELGTGERNETDQQSTTVFIAPTTIALIIEIAIIALIISGLGVLYRKRQSDKLWKNHSSTYTVKEGDDLPSVAAAHGLKWRTLARHNDIKAPYQIHKGDKLQILNHPQNQQPAKNTTKSKRK